MSWAVGNELCEGVHGTILADIFSLCVVYFGSMRPYIITGLLGLLGIGGVFWYITTHESHNSLSQSLVPVEELSDRIVLRVQAKEHIPVATTTPVAPDGPHSQWFYSDPVAFPVDKKIVGMEARIIGADTDVLHHLAVGVGNRPATLCTMHFAKMGGMHELYITSRQALDPVSLPAPYALHLAAGETLVVEFMTHAQAAPHGGHAAHEHVQPTLEVTLYTDESRTHEAHFVRLRLDDTPCAEPLAHQAFVVPPETNEFEKRSEDLGGSARYTFRESGTILAAGANFWPRKGGQSVTGYLSDEPFHTFMAELGASPWQHNIPHLTTPLAFMAGDVVSVSALYENPHSSPILDAAGMLSLYYTYDQLLPSEVATSTAASD